MTSNRKEKMLGGQRAAKELVLRKAELRRGQAAKLKRSSPKSWANLAKSKFGQSRKSDNSNARIEKSRFGQNTGFESWETHGHEGKVRGMKCQ